jgi:predicted dehydrogenase
MVGFNYIRTPASRFARQLIAEGAIGDITWFRGEHTEDFYADPRPRQLAHRRADANGTMGDLAPHMINCALALIGPIAELMAEIETVHATPPRRPVVDNDDHAQMMCRFDNRRDGASLFQPHRDGPEDGLCLRDHGTKGRDPLRPGRPERALALPRRRAGGDARLHQDPDRSGASRLPALLPGAGPWHRLSGPDHHRGTGFPAAIETGEPVWPTFRDGLAVNEVIAAFRLVMTKTWLGHPNALRASRT